MYNVNQVDKTSKIGILTAIGTGFTLCLRGRGVSDQPAKRGGMAVHGASFLCFRQIPLGIQITFSTFHFRPFRHQMPRDPPFFHVFLVWDAYLEH